jgi:hypothetical protein
MFGVLLTLTLAAAAPALGAWPQGHERLILDAGGGGEGIIGQVKGKQVVLPGAEPLGPVVPLECTRRPRC